MPANNEVIAVPCGQSEYDVESDRLYLVYSPQTIFTLYWWATHYVEPPPNDRLAVQYKVVKEVELRGASGRVQRHNPALPEELSTTHEEILGIFANSYDANVCAMIRAHRLSRLLRAGTEFCVPSIQESTVRIGNTGLIHLHTKFGGNCWYRVGACQVPVFLNP